MMEKLWGHSHCVRNGEVRDRAAHIICLPGKQLVAGPSWSSGWLYIWAPTDPARKLCGILLNRRQKNLFLKSMAILVGVINQTLETGRFYPVWTTIERFGASWVNSSISRGDEDMDEEQGLWWREADPSPQIPALTFGEHCPSIRFHSRTDWVLASFWLQRCGGYGWMILRKRRRATHSQDEGAIRNRKNNTKSLLENYLLVVCSVLKVLGVFMPLKNLLTLKTISFLSSYVTWRWTVFFGVVCGLWWSFDWKNMFMPVVLNLP